MGAGLQDNGLQEDKVKRDDTLVNRGYRFDLADGHRRHICADEESWWLSDSLARITLFEPASSGCCTGIPLPRHALCDEAVVLPGEYRLFPVPPSPARDETEKIKGVV